MAPTVPVAAGSDEEHGRIRIFIGIVLVITGCATALAPTNLAALRSDATAVAVTLAGVAIAESPREVTRLTRAQERSLRASLISSGRDDSPSTLATALHDVVTEQWIRPGRYSREPPWRARIDHRTNPSVGTELFISTKTVETHMSSVFRKLQVSNRHRLTTWATDHRIE